jgi:ABC-type multidrug transport system ATPase subunit
LSGYKLEKVIDIRTVPMIHCAYTKYTIYKEVGYMLAIDIKNLNKKYEHFHLKDISFQLEKGYIMGFIGANGAGKTTTIKSILNLIRIDSGEVHILGKEMIEHELELKQEIGSAFGDIAFYTRSKIKTLTNVIKKFYHNWDDEAYYNYLKRFNLNEDKKIAELSTGMKVKYSLALALSHGAKLLILDEPTSGLDPVARRQSVGYLSGTGGRWRNQHPVFDSYYIRLGKMCRLYYLYR